MFGWFTGQPNKAPKKEATAKRLPAGSVRILKHAPAMRVIFFYPGEEGTYVDNATVTLFENGLVHIRAKNEETTTHLQHCEILWRYEPVEQAGKDGKLRVVKFKRESERGSDADPEPPTN